MLTQWQYWPVIRPVIALLSSRKFLIALLPVLAAWGLNLTDEWIAVIIALSAAVLKGSIAYEDGQAKRSV